MRTDRVLDRPLSRPLDRPLRVLHLGSLYPPHVVGGAERSVSMLAETQAAAGWTVGAACLSPDDWHCEQRNGVEVFRMPHGNDFWMEDWPRHSPRAREWAKFKQQANFAIQRRFAEVIDRFAPDIINTHSMVDVSTRVWHAARSRRVPVVHTLRDFDLLCAASSMYRETGPCNHRHLKCRVLTFAKGYDQKLVAGVSAVGEAVLQRHLDYGFFGQVPPALRRVIWNTAAVGPAPAAAEPVRREGPLVFGYLGRISPEKGVDVLLRAAAQLPPGGWRLLIAGTAPDGLERYRALAAGLPVEFLGFVAPGELFAKVDLLVTPSLWAEPLGRIVLEAYHAGIPVIGARSGGIAEIIADDDWLVEPGNVGELAARMQRAIVEGRPGPPARRDVVAARTNPEAVAHAYAELYQAVLARGEPTARSAQ